MQYWLKNRLDVCVCKIAAVSTLNLGQGKKKMTATPRFRRKNDWRCSQVSFMSWVFFLAYPVRGCQLSCGTDSFWSTCWASSRWSSSWKRPNSWVSPDPWGWGQGYSLACHLEAACPAWWTGWSAASPRRRACTCWSAPGPSRWPHGSSSSSEESCRGVRCYP